MIVLRFRVQDTDGRKLGSYLCKWFGLLGEGGFLAWLGAMVCLWKP